MAWFAWQVATLSVWRHVGSVMRWTSPAFAKLNDSLKPAGAKVTVPAAPPPVATTKRNAWLEIAAALPGNASQKFVPLLSCSARARGLIHIVDTMSRVMTLARRRKRAVLVFSSDVT
ncbi:MAG: hypothetical protein AB7K63_06065 [Vicinamibacterales bacterium]